MRNKILKSIVLSCIFIASASTGASAEQTDPNVLAQTSARIAGSARYCKMEDDLIEEYITKVQAKLAYLSEDTYEKVLTKIEFISSKIPGKEDSVFIIYSVIRFKI